MRSLLRILAALGLIGAAVFFISKPYVVCTENPLGAVTTADDCRSVANARWFSIAIRLSALESIAAEQSQLKDISAAAATFEEILALSPGNVGVLSSFGKLYAANNRHDDAASVYSRLLEIDPNNIEALEGRAAAYLQTTLFQQAIDDYRTLTQLRPDDADVHLRYAAALRQNKDWNAAVEVLSKAIAINPKYARAYEHRAWVYAKLNQDDAALKDVEVVLAMDPTDAWSRDFAINRLVRLDKLPDALAFIDRQTELAGSSSSLEADRARVLNRMKKYDEALKAANLAITQDSKNAWAYRQRGTANIGLFNISEGIEDLEHALSLTPNDDNLRAYLQNQVRYQQRLQK